MACYSKSVTSSATETFLIVRIILYTLMVEFRVRVKVNVKVRVSVRFPEINVLSLGVQGMS